MEPYMWIVESRRKQMIGLALAAVVCLMAVLSWFHPPGGWLALEFPSLYSPTDPVQWTPADREKTLFALGLDFLFLAVYPLLLSLLCSYAARAWDIPATLARVCRAAGVWVWAATLLDAAENAGILAWVWEGQNPGLGLAISVIAGLKWLTTLSAFGIVVAAGGSALWRRIGRAKDEPGASPDRGAE